MTIERLDIPFSLDLLRRYETISETPITVDNGHYLRSHREELERQIITVVKAVASAHFAEPEDGELLSECCGAIAGEFEDVGICPECKEHCEWEKQA